MSVDIAVADFFSGCGGTTRGFADAGISPMLAVDWDRDAVATFRMNFPGTPVIERDIREVPVSDVGELLRPSSDSVMLFAGCAPCQPFAKHRQQPPGQDSRSFLLIEFLRFITALNPELVFVENVPGMQRVSASDGPFADFVEELGRTHHVSYDTVCSADYGVPQTRRRLVLVASRLGPICLPAPTHGPVAGRPYSTIREWIGSLPPIKAGQKDSGVSSHRSMTLSDLNLERIRATPEGGDRRDWPERLWPECHRDGFKGHTDVYGRLSWDRPAPALTTRCISYSNGRFGHPAQDRALSAREAAQLQTFPASFEFAGSLTSQARQIGNAVPVVLARRFGRHLVEHVTRARQTDGDGATIERLVAQRGSPAHLRMDNGPELTAEALRDWCRIWGAHTAYIEPGSPWETPFIESFNGRLRDECLNTEDFANITEARAVLEDWRTEYNTYRPHQSLGGLTPAAYAAHWKAHQHQPEHP